MEKLRLCVLRICPSCSSLYTLYHIHGRESLPSLILEIRETFPIFYLYWVNVLKYPKIIAKYILYQYVRPVLENGRQCEVWVNIRSMRGPNIISKNNGTVDYMYGHWRIHGSQTIHKGIVGSQYVLPCKVCIRPMTENVYFISNDDEIERVKNKGKDQERLRIEDVEYDPEII